MTMVTVMADSEWVLLAYRLPREPSGPRVTVWRKLRRLGAVQLVDGLVALPAERGDGGGVRLVGRRGDRGRRRGVDVAGDAVRRPQDRALRQQLRHAVVEEYAALTAEAKTAGDDRRTVQRLRRTLRDIERRDFVAPKRARRSRAAPCSGWSTSSGLGETVR